MKKQTKNILIVLLIIAGIFLFSYLKPLAFYENVIWCEEQPGDGPLGGKWLKYKSLTGYISELHDRCEGNYLIHYSCGERWGYITTNRDKISCDYGCEDAKCNPPPPCISHHEKKCYNDDVYWYDSCGDREERYQDCAYKCQNGQCIQDPCEYVTCPDKCQNSVRYYNGYCDPSTGECVYQTETCTYGCLGNLCAPTPTTILVYRLENNICTQLTVLESERQMNDYDTLNQCEEGIEPTPVPEPTPPPEPPTPFPILILVLIIGGVIGLIFLYIKFR